MEFALFGAGCFWGIQAVFDKLEGVVNTEVGYSGGDFDNPSYREVCSGSTGHAEVIRIEFFRPDRKNINRLVKYISKVIIDLFEIVCMYQKNDIYIRILIIQSSTD